VILLDTQAVYWSMTGTGRFGRSALERLSSAGNRYVSSISHVEFAIKQLKGKLHLPNDLADGLARIGLTGLAFTEVHAAALREFPSLVGHDPFDRMLVAQAKSERLEFLTSDRALLKLDLPWIIDATR